MRLMLFLVFVHLVLLVCGYPYVKRSKILAGKPALELCTGYALSLLWFGVAAMLGYVCKLPALSIRLALLAVVVGGLVLFVRDKLWQPLMTVFRWPLTALVLMSSFTCL